MSAELLNLKLLSSKEKSYGIGHVREVTEKVAN